jgi:hypothetical protein
MDGAIADAEGEPFPLVTTTSKNVIGNLTRNLNSYLKQEGTRRKVVLATSQDLSPRKIQNLYKRASELGFLLLNVHAQAATANLLYRSPEWCKELLNLMGDPCPLSVVPRTTRPQLSQSLIGRDKDLAWLTESNGDRLLVGQPGSGKTSLLRELVSHGLALFVVSRDRGELAAAIRKQEPETLIVDDAQAYHDVILDLIQIREETGAKFSILVSSWPSFQSKIAETLNLTEKAVHRLDLLPRDDIVAVIKATGIHGPDELIREIVNQAQGRPGLAVTLAYLCLQGGVQELLSGDALNRSINSIRRGRAIQKIEEHILPEAVKGLIGAMIKIILV